MTSVNYDFGGLVVFYHCYAAIVDQTKNNDRYVKGIELWFGELGLYLQQSRSTMGNHVILVRDIVVRVYQSDIFYVGYPHENG